jgi:hypothetical protein
MPEGHEHNVGLFVSRSDSAESFDPPEQTLDCPSIVSHLSSAHTSRCPAFVQFRPKQNKQSIKTDLCLCRSESCA